jgi:hypothetical protein
VRKRLIALLTGAMVFCGGCSVFFPAAPADTPPTPAGESPYLAEFRDNWCYDRLTQPLRQCYAALYDAVRQAVNTDSVVTVSQANTDEPLDRAQMTFPGVRVALPVHVDNERDAKRLYEAFTWDNPQFYFLSNDYYYEGYRNEKTGELVCRSLCLAFTMSAAERRVAGARLEQALDEFTRDLPRGDDFARERLLHDRLLQRCSYYTEAGASHDTRMYPGAFTAYGALVEGKAVCEGYSRGMQLLLHRAGIECSLVTGINENDAPHMWNLVTINGRNYHLDPTWDDVDERIRYTFFNVTTEAIARTHTIDEDAIGVDTCTATQDNYYRRTNHFINSFDRDDIAAVIARDMDADEPVIDLQFDPPTFINGQLLISNRQLLADLIRQQAADAAVWDDYEMRVNTTYYTIALYRL